jgi:DNA-binding FadR family transcriptional regulator
MPGVSQAARDEYARALSLYDRANQLLAGDDPSDVELLEARRSLEEGRARLAAARAALTQPATPPMTPPPPPPPAN